MPRRPRQWSCAAQTRLRLLNGQHGTPRATAVPIEGPSFIRACADQQQLASVWLQWADNRSKNQEIPLSLQHKLTKHNGNAPYILPEHISTKVQKWQQYIKLGHKIKILRWIPLPIITEYCYVLTVGDGGENDFGARCFILVPLKDLPENSPKSNVFIDDIPIFRASKLFHTHKSCYGLSKIKVVSQSQTHKWSAQKRQLNGAHLAAQLTGFVR